MTIRVLAAVICEENRYLICRRPQHKRHGSLWEFPGGKVEPGETNFIAAARELKEELDLEVISVGSPMFTRKDEGSIFSIEFMPVKVKGAPKTIEHSELAWVKADQLSAYSLAPSDQAFAERFLINDRSVGTK